MNISDFIKTLQDKPHETKTRILWASGTVAAILVFGVWFGTFKNEVKNLNVSAVVTTKTTPESAPHYLSVDAFLVKDGNLLLYFSIKNDTDDILNFSKISDIELALGGKKFPATAITDRANQPFVQKVLSHSQTFGVLTFVNPSAQTGQLTFDNLYFEQSPQNLFKEIIPINLDKLAKPQDIRN